jgi:outer membrane protein
MRAHLSLVALCFLSVWACAPNVEVPPSVAVVSAQPASQQAPAGAIRIAVVDLQHAVLMTREGQRAQVSLKQVYDQWQKELDTKNAELTRERQELDRQAPSLTKSVLDKRREDLQRKETELKAVFVEHDRDLKKRQDELTAPIVRKMVSIVSQKGEASGYDLVIDKQAVPFARTSLDLTDQVVRAYDEGP